MTFKKFKITFVYPDFESIGIEYLMSLCLKAGHRVELVFYQAENAYLGKKKKDISFKTIALKIAKTNPDLVAFSCVTDNYQYQLNCAKALKKIKPKITTIFGGIHPTAVPKQVLQESAVDAVAIGEADISFIQFLKNSRKEDAQFILPDKIIKGIVFKKNGKQIGEFKEGELIDLDTLPFPYKEPFFQVLKETSFKYAIITSRGCPYSCSYCIQATIHKMRGRRIFRQRTADNVIDELLWAKKKYKFKIVYFMDDLFTTNKNWLLRFLRLYQRKIGLPFGCATHPECLDRQLANLLGSAGCIFASFGVQSLSSGLSREVLNRQIDKKKVIQTIKYLKEAGVMVQTDHILGIPGDTLKNQEEAVLFYNKHRPDLVSVFWLTYYPKTPIVQTALNQRMLSYQDIKKIERGEKVANGTFHDGGSMKNPKPYYSIQFMLNYLPFLPKWLIRLLIKTGWYQVFGIRNFYLATALPRIIRSATDKRDFWGRSLLISFFNPKD